MIKRIVLCADDFGQTPAISQGILALIQLGRLTATSCLVNMPCWAAHSCWLLPWQTQIDIGLHFNLTEGVALSAQFQSAYGKQLFSLPVLMRKIFFGTINRSIIEAECHAQLDCFEKSLGFSPHFMDGHQHVHQFPIIRQAFMAVYKQRLNGQKAYVRLAYPRFLFTDYSSVIKKTMIIALGARSFQGLLVQQQIPHNQSFSGIYSFSKSSHYQHLFRRFLEEIATEGLMMCHPAFITPVTAMEKDPIYKARQNEYRYFSSQLFIEDCRLAGVALKRFASLKSHPYP
jgi:hypothetical protein